MMGINTDFYYVNEYCYVLMKSWLVLCINEFYIILMNVMWLYWLNVIVHKWMNEWMKYVIRW